MDRSFFLVLPIHSLVPGQEKKFSSSVREELQINPFGWWCPVYFMLSVLEGRNLCGMPLLLDWRSGNSGLPFSVLWEIEGILALFVVVVFSPPVLGP